MLRWSLLAIAFAIGACGDGERDRMSGETSDAAADAAIAPADTGTIETGAASTATPLADTGAIEAGATGGAEARGPTGAEAMGGTRGAGTGAGAPVGTSPLDLTPDRVRQLQAALNDDGCDAGPVDGIVGPRTRRAIDCGLEKHDLESGDHGGLYRALNLNF